MPAITKKVNPRQARANIKTLLDTPLTEILGISTIEKPITAALGLTGLDTSQASLIHYSHEGIPLHAANYKVKADKLTVRDFLWAQLSRQYRLPINSSAALDEFNALNNETKVRIYRQALEQAKLHIPEMEMDGYYQHASEYTTFIQALERAATKAPLRAYEQHALSDGMGTLHVFAEKEKNAQQNATSKNNSAPVIAHHLLTRITGELNVLLPALGVEPQRAQQAAR